MGDLPPGSRPQTMEHTATGFSRDGSQNYPASSTSPYKSPDNNTPFFSQLSAIPHNQLRPDYLPPSHSSAQFTPKDHGASSLNMASMAGALPDYTSVDEASLSGASSSAVTYPSGQSLQMPAHPSSGIPGYSSYGNTYAAGPYQQQSFGQSSQHNGYPPFGTNQPRMPGGSQMQPPFQNYVQPSQYMYYPAPYAAQGQYNLGYQAQGAQNHAMYERRGSMVGASAGLNGSHSMDYQHYDGTIGGARMGSAEQAAIGSAYNAPYARGQGMSHSGPVSSIPRGPPRKPKQSGHALWVGNLPPGTTVMALKDHFSRDATKDIESLFLISKSNCAFVNYRSEASCTAAMHRFHDSRFNGVRLVCRLRRSSAPASGVPTGPSAMVGTQQTNNVSPPRTPKVDGEVVDGLQDSDHDTSLQKDGEGEPRTSDSPNKYFIVKSLTLQDLELSVRNGIWATQSHNEDVLNKAFRTTENVYLIFSANKSGEYFGYARMTSPILEETPRTAEPAPKLDNPVDATDVPKSIPTPATEWAPRGKIIDDSARGTIFWEAELSDAELEDDVPETQEDRNVDGVVAQSWGKPFKIEWVSTNRLPFYRTRGLRNPWNANREVKIARDGTELEPSVGDRLVQMFQRVGPGAQVTQQMGQQMQVGGPVMPMMPMMRGF